MMRCSETQTISKRLRILLILRDSSVPDLSRRISVSEKTIYRWIAGSNAPSFSNLESICRALHVSIRWMIGKAPLDDANE